MMLVRKLVTKIIQMPNHPLKKISTITKATAYEIIHTESTDQYQNRIVVDKLQPIEIELMIKKKGNPKFGTPPDPKTVQPVTCYLVTEGVELSRLSNDMQLEDGSNLTVVSRQQALLKVIKKVFGQSFEGYIYI